MMCIEDAAVPISSAKLTGIVAIRVPTTVGTSDLFKAQYRGLLCVCVCVCVCAHACVYACGHSLYPGLTKSERGI